VDQEMRTAIAEIVKATEDSRAASMSAATAAQAATTAANAATAAANATTAALHGVNKEQRALRRDFGVLWRKVHGSTSSSPPPPDGDPERAPAEAHGEPGIIDQIETVEGATSEVSLEMAALEGRMIAAVAEVKSSVSGVKQAVMAELAQQSKEMGITDRRRSVGEWLGTRSGRREAITMLTLAVTAIGLIVGLLRGEAPKPAPSVVVVPVPSSAPSLR
jgi:hypothetical protein